MSARQCVSLPRSVEPCDAAGEAMDFLRRVVRALRTAEGENSIALGVTSAQLFVLREIERAGMLTVSDLARRTATAQSSVSEVLARLMRRGLITRTRSAVDHRCAEIALSAAGRELLTQAPETVQERLLIAFRRLSTNRQREVADGLSAWIGEARLGDIDATMFFEPLIEP